MESTDQIKNTINSLTIDEDERQELWIYHLNGHPSSAFAEYLDLIRQEYVQDLEFQQKLKQTINNTYPIQFHDLLNQFSLVEQSIMCLLALGLTPVEISWYKNIAEVRIRQAISVIRKHECWKTVYDPTLIEIE